MTAAHLEKLATGVPGFDHITDGGLSKGRSTLVSGTAGSAKTVFAAQFLAEGIRGGQPGVFVTFEEPADDLRANLVSLGWDIPAWEEAGLWRFVDASPVSGPEQVVLGEFDFAALVARVRHAVDETAAQRVSLDSLGTIMAQFEGSAVTRQQLRWLSLELRTLGVTVVMTVERPAEHGPVSRLGVEEFVADNVVIFRNTQEEEKRRRTVEVLKLRGANHRKGEYPFTVLPGAGIRVIPLSSIELTSRSSDTRVTSGNQQLDEMCGGGLFKDSITLVSGATGTGKTLTTAEFLAGGLRAGEKCVLLAFEESRDQLFRNARGWGYDFQSAEASGQLVLRAAYPETASLEDHLVTLKGVLDTYGPSRLALDSLSALERIATVKSFREFLIGLTSFVKDAEVTSLFTAATPTLFGGTSVTEAHISTLTDTILLLRYVEMYGEVRRGLTVLKMRGSTHDKQIREFEIDGSGMHIGRPFRSVGGILGGTSVSVDGSEADRVSGLFRD